MLDFIAWWVSVEVLGLAVLPLAFFLFAGLPDRGYAFIKPLGMVLVGYLFWLIGLTGLLPNSGWIIALVVVLLALALYYLFRRRWREMVAFLYRERRVILAMELLFLVAFVGWALVRSYDPAINHTEQPMDFAFLNATIQADSFPPQDPWLSGNSISYYYFGYLINGGLSKVTGVPGGVSYNLAIALIFALTAVAAFGLVLNLVRLHRGGRRGGLGIPMGVGFLGAVFVVGIGNLEGLLESVRSLGLGSEGFYDWLAIKNLQGTVDNVSLYPQEAGWWWFRASRVIDTVEGGRSLDFTITEFPSFSFTLGDLHPHVMSLPFLLLALGLGLQALRSQEAFGLGWLRRHPATLVVIAVCLGALGFLNSWDLPTGVAVFLALTLLQSYRVWGRWEWERFREWAIFAVVLGVLSLLLFLPFYLGLKTQVSGVVPVQDANTRYIHYLLVLGLFLFFTLSFLLLRSWGLWRRRARLEPGRRAFPWPEASASAMLALAPFVFWAFLVLGIGLVKGDAADSLGEIGGRFLRLLPMHAILALGLFAIVRSVRAERRPDSPRMTGTLFALTLLTFGFALTLGPELFRIVDVFDNRMNTVFKFYYQAWIMLAVASAFGAYYVARRWRWSGAGRAAVGASWGGVAVLLVAGSLLYPFGAVYDKTGGFDSEPTLNGLAFVGARDEAEMEALDMLVRDGEANAVVVEAVGMDRGGYPAGDYYLGFDGEGRRLDLE
ncbi:MAG: DUF2298 domain-containing protein, partial [Dehalococcoidia bacterium]